MEARAALCIFLVLLLVRCNEGLNPNINGHGPKLLFVFGDSDVDTGNTLKPIAASWQFPYGTSFPGKPTGRYSDGRVLTDYIAAELGLPSPVPYRDRRVAGSGLQYGMNLAYAGAGVFDTYTFSPTISEQIDQLEQLVNDGTYSRQQLGSALAFVSVAGNDYASYIINNGSLEGMVVFTGKVVKQISVELQRLSRLGLGKILIAGVEALGCMPVVTRLFTQYTACADPVNGNAIFHNSMLQNVVNSINADSGRPSHVAVLDIFDAFNSILHGRSQLGARFENRFKPCCLGVNVTGLLNGNDCSTIDEKGRPMYTICNNPGAYFFWDRVHPTQAGWSSVVQFLHPAIQKFIST